MKAYLIALIAVIITALAAMTVLAGVGIYACLDCDVLRFQEHKIAGLTPDVDTVVLGDSAIGYALDAETFSELSHRKTVKLALTGVNYGIGGAYVLLAEVLARDVRPKNVLIVLSAQTLMVAMWKIRWRPIRGFLQAARRHPRLLFGVSDEISWRVAEEIGMEMFDRQLLMDGIKYVGGKRPVIDDFFFRHDYYLPAIDVVKLPEDSSYALEGVPTVDYDVFFEKIAGLCKTNGINCVFMFGPLMQKIVEHSALTFRWETAQIERAGIKVIKESPIKIPDEDLGNTINHIQPYVKQEYTRKIYDLVAASLR
jgi:hypothetical protein